jgi:AcrR family transcriptional regulator
MNETSPTAAALIRAARELFALHGYDGTSVRAITARARANLGAITYHFGSKQALHDAVIASVMGPGRERIIEAAAGPGTPLDRLEAVVRVFFGYLYDNPDAIPLMLGIMLSSRPLPDVVRRTIEANIETLSLLIAEGQRDGSVRSGDPRMLALSVAAQPLWLALTRRALYEGVAFDQTDPETRVQLVESVLRFVGAGLAAHPESSE